jgi:hypothetical protein
MSMFKFIIEKTKTGYSAFEVKYPIFTTGRTMHELQEKCFEATNLYLEEYNKSTTKGNLSYELDFKQFFNYYKVINAKHLAARIGMNESLLSQYVNGKKKPSKKQVARIVDGLHEIGRELVELTLV